MHVYFLAYLAFDTPDSFFAATSLSYLICATS